MNKTNLNHLNKFIKSTSVAKGGEIDVDIYDGGSSYKPSSKLQWMKLEDCNLIHDLCMGATHFLFYLERNGYTITKRRKKK